MATYEVRIKGNDCIGHFTDQLVGRFSNPKEAMRFAKQFAKEDHERTKGERGEHRVYVRAIVFEPPTLGKRGIYYVSTGAPASGRSTGK